MTGIIRVFFRDYDGTNHTEIGEGTLFARDWQSGSSTFVERMALVRGMQHTIPAGNRVEFWVVVDDESEADMWLAYDTVTYSSLINLDYEAPTPTVSFYLHDNPTPPTTGSNVIDNEVLTADQISPTATTLFNYSQNRDTDLGLQLDKTAAGISESTATKYQIWRTAALDSSLDITGDVLVDIWAAITEFRTNKTGAVTMYLRDYDGSSYTEIGNGSVFADDWHQNEASFVETTIIVPDVSYSIPAGNRLEARLIVDFVTGGQNMIFAYDTTTYSAVIKIP